MLLKKIIISLLVLFVCTGAYAQDDKKQLSSASLMDTSIKIEADTTIISKNAAVPDSLIKKKHDPAKATFRSAVFPGWGQAYNHDYWKIPFVYAALGIPAATYIYNNKWYKRTRDAYTIVVTQDTANYNKIDPKLKLFIGDPQSLQYYRNQFRRDQDYSILFFLLAWGVNVVDATVFGHLKDFDVTDDLSMHVTPVFNPSTKTPGLGIAFNLKTPRQKPLPVF